MGPCSERTLWQASSKRLTGKTSGAGSPPPKEMISGFCVTFSSSRMAELLIPSVRFAYRDFQSVDMQPPPPGEYWDQNEGHPASPAGATRPRDSRREPALLC